MNDEVEGIRKETDECSYLFRGMKFVSVTSEGTCRLCNTKQGEHRKPQQQTWFLEESRNKDFSEDEVVEPQDREVPAVEKYLKYVHETVWWPRQCDQTTVSV